MSGQKEELKPVNWQVQISSNQEPMALRHLKSELIGKLVTVKGIIVNASKNFIKGRVIAIQCKQCQNMKFLDIGCGLDGIVLPRICQSSLE